MDDDRTVSENTRAAEDVDALASHQPDKLPTEEEERLAEDATARDERRQSVAEHHQEMDRRGADQQGEGRIT